MKNFFFLSVLLFFIGCSKPEHDSIYGEVIVSGKITDYVSGQPIRNCKVGAYPVFFKKSELGGSNRVPDAFALQTVITDSLGSYSFSIAANGQYAFDFIAEPTDALHVSSVWTSGQDYAIQTAGSHVKDLRCRRSAYAKIQLKNAPPIDTCYSLNLYSYSNISLYNFYKDTTVYLKLVGNADLKSNIRFTGTNKMEQQFNIAVGPWDTIPLQINY